MPIFTKFWPKTCFSSFGPGLKTEKWSTRTRLKNGSRVAIWGGFSFFRKIYMFSVIFRYRPFWWPKNSILQPRSQNGSFFEILNFRENGDFSQNLPNFHPNWSRSSEGAWKCPGWQKTRKRHGIMKKNTRTVKYLDFVKFEIKFHFNPNFLKIPKMPDNFRECSYLSNSKIVVGSWKSK